MRSDADADGNDGNDARCRGLELRGQLECRCERRYDTSASALNGSTFDTGMVVPPQDYNLPVTDVGILQHPPCFLLCQRRIRNNQAQRATYQKSTNVSLPKPDSPGHQ
jgi:hypothetical protein